MGRRSPIVTMGAACLLFQASVQADPATAESLFREGRELLKNGQTAEACLAFAESQRLDASSGALINLASCREQEGKLASAWADFLATARLATREGKPERAEEALSRAAALEARVPKLRVKPPPSPTGARLFRDSQDLGELAFGREVPVDPGPHTIEVRAEKHVTWSKELTLSESQLLDVEVPALEAQTPPAAAGQTVAPERAPIPAPLPQLADPSPLYMLGVVSAGLAVVAVSLGAALGSEASTLAAESDTQCKPVCTRTGADLNERALAFADGATGAFIASGIAAGAGLSLVIAGATRPRSSTTAVRLAPAGLTIGGRF